MEARRGNHCAPELTLMHSGKCEMSCFFVALAPERRVSKTRGALPWNTALFLLTASKSSVSIPSVKFGPKTVMKLTLGFCRANR
jgi:hypothetical protein